METNPRDYGERCRFDAFCKTVLKHEAIDYIREMKRRASRETSLERLPQAAMDKLCAMDSYPSDRYVFSYCGYDLPIRSQQVADAFASLPEQEQSILILRLVLDLTDSEIGEALGLSRSAVQRRRTKSLNVLRTKLTARKGGCPMKRRNYKGRELLPLAVSDAARTGDSDAVEQVLRYYEGYINKLCTQTVYDESSCPRACLDEYMKSRLENKLIRAILGVN